MAYERIQIVGNLGAIERRVSKTSGTEFISLRVAVDRNKHKGKQVIWYEVLLFGSMVKSDLMAHYSVGREVLVEGRPQVDIYQKKDGTFAVNNVIIASGMPELLGSGRRS